MNSFSQNDTTSQSDKSYVKIPTPVAKLIAKDLIEGDGAKKELKLTVKKVSLLQQKSILQDSTINILKIKVLNLEDMLDIRSNQLILSDRLSQRLQTDLKKQKVRNKITMGAGILGIVGIIVLSNQ